MESEISLSTCCRTCLRTSCGLTLLSACDQDSVKFDLKLMACMAEIAWQQEEFPSYICDQCIDQLRISFDFRNTCLASNETLQKYLKQSYLDKNDTKNILFECITSNNRSNSLNSLSADDSSTAEYLHLKHFLDSESELTKNESLSPAGRISRSSSPESNTEHFMTNYEESQGNEIAHDIQEIIVQEKSNETEQNKVILSDGQEYRIQDLQFVDKDSKPLNGNIDCKELIIKGHHLETNVLITKVDAADNSKSKETLGSGEILSIKNEVLCKLTRDAGTQVRSVSPESKKPIQEKLNICQVCGKSYKKRANLKVHMRSHTGEKPFECKYCVKRFHHSSHLKEHIRRHTGEKPYQCEVCMKRFTIKGELTMHMKSHTGEKPHACSVCDRRCLTATDLKIHMRTHTGEKPYACDHCDRRFSSPYILSSHMKVHTGERPFQCNLCQKNFTQSSHLNVHMKKHTGEKFTCKLCPATFEHSSQLTVHKRAHTGKQPYKCGVCDKLCNYASELQTHMTKHTGQKFECSICPKQFSSQAYLQEHNRVHTGENLYNCKICDRHFTRQQYLQKHMRTHTGEKPYSCTVCDKSFSQSSSLKVHLRIHTGERPYSCTVCDKSFMTSSDLTSHTKKHKKYIDL